MPCVRPEGIMSAPYQSPKQNKRRIAKDVQLSSFSIRNYGLNLAASHTNNRFGG